MAREPAGVIEPGRVRPAWVVRRWPTALALVVSVPGFPRSGRPGPDPGPRRGDAAAPPLVRRRRGGRTAELTWPVLVAGIALFVLLQLQDAVAPAVVLAGIALAGVLWGAVRGRLAQPSFLLQAAGLVTFGALALTGLSLASDVGTSDLARYVVAAGWFAHGLWDFAHHRADAGVRRSGAEWCGVVDVLVAVQLVVVPLVV